MTEVLTVKVAPELKQALRAIAYRDGHSSYGKVIKQILEANPKIIREKNKLKKDLVGK